MQPIRAEVARNPRRGQLAASARHGACGCHQPRASTWGICMCICPSMRPSNRWRPWHRSMGLGRRPLSNGENVCFVYHNEDKQCIPLAIPFFVDCPGAKHLLNASRIIGNECHVQGKPKGKNQIPLGNTYNTWLGV